MGVKDCPKLVTLFSRLVSFHHNLMLSDQSSISNYLVENPIALRTGKEASFVIKCIHVVDFARVEWEIASVYLVDYINHDA